jgi:hypothetical protein
MREAVLWHASFDRVDVEVGENADKTQMMAMAATSSSATLLTFF